MRLIHSVIKISQKCMSSADVWKYRDSVLGHEDCLAANSKSTGPPQKGADDRNCSIDSAIRPTSAEWQNADVDGQWLLLWAYNCSSSTAEQFHGDIDTLETLSQIQLYWERCSLGIAVMCCIKWTKLFHEGRSKSFELWYIRLQLLLLFIHHENAPFLCTPVGVLRMSCHCRALNRNDLAEKWACCCIAVVQSVAGFTKVEPHSVWFCQSLNKYMCEFFICMCEYAIVSICVSRKWEHLSQIQLHNTDMRGSQKVFELQYVTKNFVLSINQLKVPSLIIVWAGCGNDVIHGNLWRHRALSWNDLEC